MNKEEFIAKYSEVAYAKRLAQTRQWNADHPEQMAAYNRARYKLHPERAVASAGQQHRKGGKYYETTLEYNKTGLRGERRTVRGKHQRQYRQYKHIIAPGSQIHHEWIPGTADYRGVALVEADQHMHRIVDVISILEGEITLRTEAEIKGEIMNG